MQTAAYLRVSSDKQDVARQRDSTNRCAERLGRTITLRFEDSIGRNPRDLPHKRKGFQAMLQAVEAGLVDCIIVDSQDRFGTRDAYQYGRFIDLLREHGCKLLDASGKELSADDDGSVLAGTIGALTSKREQREKAERNVTGKLAKAKRGEYQGGYPPFGLDVVCFGPDGKEKWRTVYVGQFDRWKVYPSGKRERFKGKDNTPAKDASDTLYLRPTIEEDRLEVARQVFKWYASESISPRQIAKRLTDAKVSSIYGKAWDKVRIASMLGNPAYIGLPTWNKRGGGRFVEWVNGQTRAVNGAKSGRRRDKSDHIAPDKPIYKPIIDAKTWAKVQEKLQAASDDQLAVVKRPPKTAELWLKPFLVCGQCGKPMRATRGESPGTGGKYRLWPSYFCGTYGTYGKDNPTGCHCHRVRHDYLVNVVTDYVKQTAPKVAQLLEATETGNLELARPLLEQLSISRRAESSVWFDMVAFIDEHATAKERRADDLDAAYGLAYKRLRPKLEAKVTELERELDGMLEDFRTLSPKLRDRANTKMEALDEEIKQLKRDTADLRVPWFNLKADVEARKQAIDKANQVLGNGAAHRQKTEALSAVVDKIVCHFHHTQTKANENHGKSYLDRVEIHSVAGDKVCFTNGNAPVPG